MATPAEAAGQAATEACQLLPRDLNNGVPLTTLGRRFFVGMSVAF